MDIGTLLHGNDGRLDVGAIESDDASDGGLTGRRTGHGLAPSTDAGSMSIRKSIVGHVVRDGGDDQGIGIVATRDGHVTAQQPSGSLLLIHGGGSGAWIFESWYRQFPGMVVRAVGLQENVNVDRAGMGDYARVVVEASRRLPSPASLCGWSMGGLVALMASQWVRPHALVLIEPSAPAEIQGIHPEVELVHGRFDPEEVYGRFPSGQKARLESSLARSERKRGISLPIVPCPTLVVYGHDFPDERGRAVARLYGSDEHHFPDLGHWGLITDERVPKAIACYLGGL